MTNEIKVGDLIEIRQPGKRRWAMRVAWIHVESATLSALQGKQVRMVDGLESRERTALVRPSEYTIIERAKPAAPKTLGEMTPGERDATIKRVIASFQGELDRTAPAIGRVLDGGTVAAEQPRPARVTATVADDDNVPVLSDAQIGALHWLGAPEIVVKSYPGERPSRPTIGSLRRMGLCVEYSLDLNEAGRALYLANKPTGRLSRPFNDAWREAVAASVNEIVAEMDSRTEPEVEAKPELPTLDELELAIHEYAAAHINGGAGAGARWEAIREMLEMLYREAGR